MAMTNGARRRNAYVTAVMGVGFFFALLFTAPSNWFTTCLFIIDGALTSSAVRTLADIGFTKRADNER